MDLLLTEIIIFILLMAFAGFFSAAEVAIASFGSNKIDEMEERGDKLAPVFLKIQKDADSFFGTIHIATIMLLITMAMVLAKIFLQLLPPLLINSGVSLLPYYSNAIAVGASIVVDTFFALVFCILIPRSLGFKYAESIGRFSVRGLLLLTKVMRVPTKIITSVSNLFLKPLKEETNFLRTRFSEDEIKNIISEGVKSGALDETEQEIIENIFEFNDLRANEVMIPRTDMVSLELVGDISLITEEVIRTGHSLIPVYEDSIDNIVGVLHTKDFMKSLIDGRPVILKNLIRPAYFIPEKKLISEILKEMQKRGERLAIVTDEYGGTEGVITVEDILEEIVGVLTDKTKEEVKEYSILPDGSYYVLGSMDIDDFNETFNIELPASDEYNTVAGFIAEQTGKILNASENFQYGNLVFELIKKIRQKMVQFKVYPIDGDFKETDKEK
ncbi:MAG: hemolysin family protein [Ignavibacteriaceae bacterium]|nr:hemolysin family protein [Ignavibacteriaceae bacterium]